MFGKFKSLLGLAPEQVTAIIVSPDPPPRGGVLSLSQTKKNTKDKQRFVFSAEHVGGKGANLLRLRAAGLNVPPFMVVPAQEWDDVLMKATEVAGESLEGWFSGEAPDANKRIAEALDKVDLSEEVSALIRAFVGGDRSRAFAVRSSATVEDASDSAYAGQFETVLNVHGIENIVAAVKTCWKSLIADSVLPFYDKTLEKRPRMAVVIQEQVDSAKAGVYFQANPVTGAMSTHIVNVAYGQGDGVVSGTVPSDEFWLSADTGKCFKSVLSTKTEKIGLAEVKDGTRRDAIDASEQNKPALSDDELKLLYTEAKKLKGAFYSPQDIEFGFNNSGELFIFQARPITTRLENMKFEPKDVGLWRLNSHVSVPMSALYEPIWLDGWSKGCLFNSKLTGSGFVAVDTIALNGFGYFCLRFPGPKAPPTSPPPKFLMRTILTLTGGKDTKAARAFWEKKGFLDFAHQFEEKLKPEWIAKHRKLQTEAENVKTREQAVAHLRASHEHLKEAWYAHVTYTLYQMLPAAFFVQKTMEWSNCDEADAWGALEGFSPVTKGLSGEFSAQIKTLKASEAAKELLTEPSDDPSKVLDELQKLDGEVGEAANKVIGDMSYRLMGGYDPANAILKESPEFLLGLIRSAVLSKSSEGNTDVSSSAERIVGEIWKKIPAKHLADFDRLLQETRSIMKLRDERALYTDLWASGILHDAVLRCAEWVEKNNVQTANVSGERLRKLMLEGSFEELVNVTENGLTPEIVEVWKQRKHHRESASIRDAPALLGGHDVEITPEHFPNEWLARSFSTIMMATKATSTPTDFEQQYKDVEGFLKDSQKIVIGLPASKGVVEGVVCVLRTEDDVTRVQKGQIIVAESPSSLINLVLPLAAAIVCDFGATLSHAAVCAREQRIPCVVGTKIASRIFKDGQRIRVDGGSGRVQLLE